MDNLTLMDDNISSIESVRGIVAPLSDATYARTVEAVFAGSVGKHLRHMLDHYQQFFRGWPERLVDYDCRERSQAVETSVADGVQQIDRLCELLSGLRNAAQQDPALLSATLQVRYASSPEMITGLLTDSTLSREMAFLHSHTVHHIAMMTVILQQVGVAADRRLALAPSTARHEDQLV